MKLHWFAAIVAVGALLGGVANAEERCGATLHSRFGETRAYFRDTLAACRRDGYCSAVVALPDRTGGGAAYAAQLRVARRLAGEPYEVEFVAVTPMPSPTQGSMILTFPAEVNLANVIALKPQSANEFRITDQDVADDVVRRLKRARSARWTYTGEAGPHTANFPLRGMTAALTWIDCMGRGHGAE